MRFTHSVSSQGRNRKKLTFFCLFAIILLHMSVFTESLQHTEGLGRHNYVYLFTTVAEFNPGQDMLNQNTHVSVADGAGLLATIYGPQEPNAIVQVTESPDHQSAVVKVTYLPKDTLTDSMEDLDQLITPDNTTTTTIGSNEPAVVSGHTQFSDGTRRSVIITAMQGQ
jgi:hypothetical protein